MMHDSALHLTEDELHDAADGTHPLADTSRGARHLLHCARCRTDVERIRELLALAATLPRSVEPPADLWPDIQARIRRQPGATSAPAVHRSRWDSFTSDRRWLAAAAVVLIAVSSAVTALIYQPSGSFVVEAPDSLASPERTPEVRTVRDDYDRLDRELMQLLAAQREKMQPETIAKVERNLAIIDQAIAEIRAALVEDPSNQALHDLLKRSYGQKRALLDQVSKT